MRDLCYNRLRKRGESMKDKGSRTHTPPKVAILFSLALEGERNMCRGILDYAHRHGPWRCHLFEGRSDEQRLNLRKEKFDGIIAAGGNRKMNSVYTVLGVPFVLLEAQPEMRDQTGMATKVPYVTRDSRAIGALAASYYLERGYTSFAFVGEPNGAYWSEERGKGFQEALAKAGFGCAVHARLTARERKNWSAERPRIERFLLGLPRPTALFAAMDGRARLIVNLCTEIGLKVPEEIAVLGVDNDPLLCGSTVPALSSIRTGGYRRGQIAASILDDLLHGRPVRESAVAQEPLAVVTRRSTGYDAMRDLYVARAVKFIRDSIEAGEVTDVADVIREAHCSRRYLERHFRAGLGRSIHDEIMATRMDRVKMLLSSTDLPIGEIAALSGYNRVSRLAAMFRRETGTNMRQWRLENRETGSR